MVSLVIALTVLSMYICDAHVIETGVKAPGAHRARVGILCLNNSDEHGWH